MPYKSSKQRAYMHANHPEIAKKWNKKYGGKIDQDTARKAVKKATGY